MAKPSVKKVAGYVGAALALAYATSSSATITAPGGFGESFMHFTNFSFSIADGAPGTTGNPLGTAGSTGTETSTASAILNGIGSAPVGCGVTNLGQSYSCLATTGVGFAPGGKYAAQTTDPLAPAGAGSAGLSESTGDSRTGTAEVYLHALSQLAGGGTSNSSSTQDLNATFTLSASPVDIPVELAFDAEYFIRAGLGQDNISANATSVFTVTVKRGGTVIFLWTPSGDATSDLLGTCVGGGSCVTWGDPFSLNSNVTVDHTLTDDSADAGGNQITYAGTGARTGSFEAELLLPKGFAYTVEINGRVTSSTRVPEPGTIALLGLGLFGLGAVARRKRPV